MLLRTILAVLLATALTTARAAIDLTPTAHESTCEGFTFKELLFQDGKRQIVYQLPAKWTYRAGGDGLHLTPPQTAYADAIIQAAALPAPQRLDEKSIEAARQQFMSNFPPGSQMITLVSEEQNSVPLNGNATYEITASYQVMGETFLRSAVFSNLADTQMCFRLTARKSDFGRLHQVFRASILSWRWFESSPSPAKNGPAVATAPAPAPSSTN